MKLAHRGSRLGLVLLRISRRLHKARGYAAILAWDYTLLGKCASECYPMILHPAHTLEDCRSSFGHSECIHWRKPKAIGAHLSKNRAALPRPAFAGCCLGDHAHLPILIRPCMLHMHPCTPVQDAPRRCVRSPPCGVCPLLMYTVQNRLKDLARCARCSRTLL